MSTNRTNIVNALSKKGSLPALRQQFATGSGNDLVTVQDWQATYGSNGLTESCTVSAKNNSSSITSVGLISCLRPGAAIHYAVIAR
jgi:hypothetical protein